MNEQLARLREWFEKLAPRERRMMSILGAAFAAFLVFLVPLGLSLTLSSRRDVNKSLRDAIFTIKNSRDEIQKRQERRDAITPREIRVQWVDRRTSEPQTPLSDILVS